jgi:hypothetical protein
MFLTLLALLATGIGVTLGGVCAFVAVGGDGGGGRRAAIVDQLGTTAPNPELVANATQLLREAGYAVSYIPSEAVTVDFYRTLPEQRYDLLILRSHAAVRENAPPGADPGGIALFTSEEYNPTTHEEDLVNKRLAIAYQEGSSRYFGIPPDFVEFAMEGSFRGASVVLLGCDGLRSEQMARAFTGRGARRFISWDESVTVTHNDAATLQLLSLLVSERLPAAQAVDRTMQEIGADPVTGSRLRIFER